MKIALILLAAVSAFALDISHLSDDITNAIRSKESAIEAGRKRQKYDFVGGVNLSASVDRDRAINSTEWEQSEGYGASFSQDLFRSGGILASMRYADKWAVLELLRLRQEANSYLQNLTILVLQSRQDAIRLEQSDLAIKNAEITLTIKRSQYEAGEADITQLNDALKSRNDAQKSRIAILNESRSRFEEIAKISPFDPREIPIAPFAPILAEEFLSSSIAPQIAVISQEIAKEQETLTMSRYLPTISANANANRRHNDMIDGTSYGYGLTLSIPLAVTEGWTIEEKRLETLRARSQESLAREEAKRIFEQYRSAVESAQESIAVSEENIAFYDTLINVAKAQAQSGDRSRYDHIMLENTRKSDLLEIESSKISVEIERARLFYATDRGQI